MLINQFWFIDTKSLNNYFAVFLKINYHIDILSKIYVILFKYRIEKNNCVIEDRNLVYPVLILEWILHEIVIFRGGSKNDFLACQVMNYKQNFFGFWKIYCNRQYFGTSQAVSNVVLIRPWNILLKKLTYRNIPCLSLETFCLSSLR